MSCCCGAFKLLNFMFDKKSAILIETHTFDPDAVPLFRRCHLRGYPGFSWCPFSRTCCCTLDVRCQVVQGGALSSSAFKQASRGLRKIKGVRVEFVAFTKSGRFIPANQRNTRRDVLRIAALIERRARFGQPVPLSASTEAVYSSRASADTVRDSDTCVECPREIGGRPHYSAGLLEPEFAVQSSCVGRSLRHSG